MNISVEVSAFYVINVNSQIIYTFTLQNRLYLMGRESLKNKIALLQREYDHQYSKCDTNQIRMKINIIHIV